MRIFGTFVSCIFLCLLISNVARAQLLGGFYGSGLDKSSKGDYYGAIADFTKVIEQYPNEPKPYYYRAINKFNLKDYAGALVDFDKAVLLNPKYAEAYFWRGMSKVGLKKKKEACPDFQKSLDLGYLAARDALDKYCR